MVIFVGSGLISKYVSSPLRKSGLNIQRPIQRAGNLISTHRVSMNIVNFGRFLLKKEAIRNKEKKVPENGPKVIGAYRF